MAKLIKGMSNNHIDYKIVTDEGFIYISYEDNGDLYWSFCAKDDVADWKESYKIIITPEDYGVYEELAKLYIAIKKKTPFINNSDDCSYKNDIVDIDLYKDPEEKLFKDGIIDWHSDDDPFEIASHVTIEKQEEIFEIVFYKKKNCPLYYQITIRFRNARSQYTPYNILFMDMYYSLKDYNDEFHQIHIEEYIYSKKLKRD